MRHHLRPGGSRELPHQKFAQYRNAAGAEGAGWGDQLHGDGGELPVAQGGLQLAGFDFGPGEKFGQQGQAQAGAQGGEQGLGVVGAQGTGGDGGAVFAFGGVGEAPQVAVAAVGVEQPLHGAEILRVLRVAVAGEIGGAADEQDAHLAQAAGEQGAIGQVGDAQGEIEAAGDEIDQFVGEGKLDRDIGVAGEECGQAGRQMADAEGHGGGEADQAARAAGLVGGLGFQGFAGGKQMFGAIEGGASGFAEGEAARGAVKQGAAEALFQAGDKLGDGGFGQGQFVGGAREGAGFGDFDEGGPGFEIGEFCHGAACNMVSNGNNMFRSFLFLMQSKRSTFGSTKFGQPKEINMIERRSFESLGGENHGWLDAKHHFSFANYHDPKRMNWGKLRVWNDDTIAPNSGFPAHPHSDMEIITYIREGAITHEDSMGNRGRTEAGDVQVMSAGSGIYHSEANLEPEATRLFQIWIVPNQRGKAPSWGSKPFPRGDRAGRFVVLASGFADDADALPLRADARVLGAAVKAGEEITYAIDPGRHVYVVSAAGKIEINGVAFNPRDGAAVTDESELRIKAASDAEIVMVDAA